MWERAWIHPLPTQKFSHACLYAVLLVFFAVLLLIKVLPLDCENWRRDIKCEAEFLNLVQIKSVFEGMSS